MKPLLRAGWVIIMLVVLLPGSPMQAGAQGGFEVSDVQVIYNFGEQITFQAHIQSPVGISQAFVLFREENESITRVEPLALAPDGSASFQYNAAQNIIPPFSIVIFWFQITFVDGETATSSVYNFRYDDNRFDWRQSAQGPITVHWYEGDDAFGQAALDSANASLGSIGELMPINVDAPLDVYVYANPEALQSTLYLGGSDWMGGHANPKLGVAMVVIPPSPSQGIEMDTEIPHELAHVMLYRSLGEGYQRMPTWLNEGLASVAERYPKPDYDNALKIASQKGSLLPFTDLCDAFPSDAGRAYLAYAQSQSFVRYLRDTYSPTGLSALIKAYADGLDCELGATRALGMPLTQLDTRWRESVLGQNVVGVALRNLAPYLLMLGMALAIPLWGVAKMIRERKQDEQFE
jgi:hypothetical protein